MNNVREIVTLAASYTIDAACLCSIADVMEKHEEIVPLVVKTWAFQRLWTLNDASKQWGWEEYFQLIS